MNIRKVPLQTLVSEYDHPAIVLFRSIEMKCLYAATREYDFAGPALDIGCGDGLIASLLFAEPLAYGIDNGEALDYQVAIDRQRYEKVLLESAEQMSLPDASIGFVFSNSVLEHIPAISLVLNETARVMQPGGLFVFTVPSQRYGQNLWGTRYFGRWYANMRNARLNHYNLWPFDRWKAELEKRGFIVEKAAGYMSRQALILWDRIALLTYLGNALRIKRPLRDWTAEIRVQYERENLLDPDDGSCLAIVARKK